jgi:hypothetical protein
VGDAFIGALTPPGGAPEEIVLPVRFPTFDRMRRGEVVIAVDEFKERHYTGLQVNQDPGVDVVYVGFVLMILGCYVTFFTSHQQVCIEAVRQGARTRVTVSGTANKNKAAVNAGPPAGRGPGRVEMMSHQVKTEASVAPDVTTNYPNTDTRDHHDQLRHPFRRHLHLWFRRRPTSSPGSRPAAGKTATASISAGRQRGRLRPALVELTSRIRPCAALQPLRVPGVFCRLHHLIYLVIERATPTR